jgi:hypothetical protein
MAQIGYRWDSIVLSHTPLSLFPSASESYCIGNGQQKEDLNFLLSFEQADAAT